MQKVSRIALATLFATALFSIGCQGGKAKCERYCTKAFKCDEEDEGYRDLSDCKANCREQAELVKDGCKQEYNRYYTCMKKRYDCDRGREYACERKSDGLRACLNSLQE